MTTALPPAIERRLTALVPRVRRLRVVRGACWLVVVSLLTVAVVVLLDAMFALPATARGLLLAAWVTGFGVLVWRLVVLPWRDDIPLVEVAREVERRLPKLGRQLRYVVAGTAGESELASPALQDAVAEDTTRRAKAADFTHALPSWPVPWLLAAAAVVLALSSATRLPGSGDRLRRIATPWHRAEPPAAFHVIVRSGEPVVRRGGPVTLSAYVEKFGPDAAVPSSAVLVFRDGPGAPEERLPMTGNGSAAFHVTRPCVSADFEYRVEVGSATSEWFRVTALDAVELAEGTTTEILPPPYTERPKRTLLGLPDLKELQYSGAVLKLKFTRVPASAHVEWRANPGITETIPVKLSADGLTGSIYFRMWHSGTLRLVLVTEANGKKLRTETAVAVDVVHDEPPEFELLSGVTARPRTARPGARVPISLTVRDDMHVSAAELEYRVGPDDAKSTTIPIPLSGAGTPRAAGQLVFDLTGKGKEGDTIRFRILATDNREVDGGATWFGRQYAIYPPSGWSEIRLSASAPPLALQDIACQRDAVRDLLRSAIQEVKDATAEARALRTDTEGRTALAVDDTVRLNNTRERVRRAVTTLNDLSRDASLTPDLRPLAAAVRVVAERQLKLASDALGKATSDNPTERKDAFNIGVEQLEDASTKLDELSARNEQLGQDRLDRAKLGSLASDQTALADIAKTHEKELLDRQRELLARLKVILAESEQLRLAAESAKGADARRLADAVAQLAAILRELDAAAKLTTAEARAALLSAITRDQDGLTKRAAAILAKLDTPARLAGVAAPRPEDFRRIAELAEAGKTVEALTEVEKQAQSLERIAAVFDKWAAERIDPKLGAKQLALWQDDLFGRLRAAIKATEFDKLPEETKTAFRAEQKALHEAVGLLALPPDSSVKAARDNAAIHTSKANDLLAGDGRGAESAMKLASEALNRLAEKTPTIAERLAKTLGEFQKLRQEQDTISNAVEQALRGYERQTPDASAIATFAKKLAPLVEKQRKLIPALAALDLPGLSERQARLMGVLMNAVADLQDGSPHDALASQAWARREFERFRLVLDGFVPPDAKAEELRRKLLALVELPDAKLPEGGPVVQDAHKQLGLLVAVEALALLNDTRNAVQSADFGFRDGSKPDEVRRRIRAAADELGKLSDRLNGFETDLERVYRLAGNRRLAAEKAVELSRMKAPFNPTASDEALRQLAREVDELTHTRVGAAGQLHKKRALDLYTRLRAKNEPDRMGSDQKALAETLDELAAKMADIAELATNSDRDKLLAPPLPADAFLPSKPLADALRDVAKRQRTLRDPLTNLADELAGRLRPTSNPFATLEPKQRALAADVLELAKRLTADRELAGDTANKAAEATKLAADRLRVAHMRSAKEIGESASQFLHQLATAGADRPWGKLAKELATRQDVMLDHMAELLDKPNAAAAQQTARTEELARDARELSRLLELAAKAVDPGDATGEALADAAKMTKDAEKRLSDAAKKAADGATGEAEKLRAEAETLLRVAAGRVSGAAPKPAPADTSAAIGDALRAAELAMRKATNDLAGGNPADAEKAMRDAATALGQAAKAIGKPEK